MLLRIIPLNQIEDHGYFFRAGKPSMWLKIGDAHVINLEFPRQAPIEFDFGNEFVLEYFRTEVVPEEIHKQIIDWTSNADVHL